ncbi:MAG: T9SS type A sorting domain-containing protein, partial [Bacteroidales bacterium]
GYWSDGNLANEGEVIRLEHRAGIVLDYLHYLPDEPWPVLANAGDVLMLASSDLDNHFAGNWTVASFNDLVTGVNDYYITRPLILYPNPADDIIYLKAPAYPEFFVDIYSITGKLLDRKQLDASGFTSIDLTAYSNSILIVKVGDIVEKVILSGH